MIIDPTRKMYCI